MSLTQLALTVINDFAEKYSLDISCSKVTNVYSKIILFNNSIRVTFHIEDRETFIYADIERFTMSGQCIRRERINEEDCYEALYYRKRALRSWREYKRNHFLINMMNEYISIIEKRIDLMM